MPMDIRDRDRDFMREGSPRFGPGPRDMGPPHRDMNHFPPPPERSSRTCGIRISNLPHPQNVSSERLRADLLEEASLHGRILEFQLTDRDAFVLYAEPTMAESARRLMHRMVMHNAMLEVELDLSAPPPRIEGPGPMLGKDVPAIRRKPELFDEMDDPMATCRICVDELPEGVGEAEVAAVFKVFGFIDSLVIRRPRGRRMTRLSMKPNTLNTAATSASPTPSGSSSTQMRQVAIGSSISSKSSGLRRIAGTSFPSMGPGPSMRGGGAERSSSTSSMALCMTMRCIRRRALSAMVGSAYRTNASRSVSWNSRMRPWSDASSKRSARSRSLLTF